jgi:hypothetical protein
LALSAYLGLAREALRVCGGGGAAAPSLCGVGRGGGHSTAETPSDQSYPTAIWEQQRWRVWIELLAGAVGVHEI